MRPEVLVARGFLAAIPIGITYTDTSPNLANRDAKLLARSCKPGWTTCGDGCIPVGSSCCDREHFCDPGEYCIADNGCCPVSCVTLPMHRGKTVVVTSY